MGRKDFFLNYKGNFKCRQAVLEKSQRTFAADNSPSSPPVSPEPLENEEKPKNESPSTAKPNASDAIPEKLVNHKHVTLRLTDTSGNMLNMVVSDDTHDSHGVIFVIDSSDENHQEEAKTGLQELIQTKYMK